MTRQEWCEVRASSYRADAWATATVRNRKGLVQIQVANVAAELAEFRVTNYRVGVCAVDVNLTAGGVHSLAKVDHRFFKHSVGRRVGDHDCRELVAGCVDFLLQVVEVNVSVFVALDHDNAHARQDRRGGVGAVCARRN